MPLISLVYVSVETYKLSDSDLKDILTTSRLNNKKLEVTGMLLYRDGFFIQALEGEEEVVRALYQKIEKDPRHKSVVSLASNPIRKRTFGQWQMGFNKVDDESIRHMDGYTDLLEKPSPTYFTTKPSRALLLLDVFKDRIYTL